MNSDSNQVSPHYCTPPSHQPATNLVYKGERRATMPIVSLLGGKSVHAEGISLVFHAARSNSIHLARYFDQWKVFSISQLLSAVEATHPKIINVSRHSSILASIDRMQCELGFDTATICCLIIDRLVKDNSPEKRGKTKEVVLSYLLSDYPDQLMEIASVGRGLFNHSQGQCNWDSPGYIRLSDAESNCFLDLLKLLVTYFGVPDTQADVTSLRNSIQLWKKLTWKTEEFTDYLYAEEELFSRILDTAEAVGMSPPTVTERITHLIGSSRTDVMQRFSDKIRRSKLNVYRMTFEEVKKELAESYEEISMKLPWELNNSEQVEAQKQVNKIPTTACGK